MLWYLDGLGGILDRFTIKMRCQNLDLGWFFWCQEALVEVFSSKIMIVGPETEIAKIVCGTQEFKPTVGLHNIFSLQASGRNFALRTMHVFWQVVYRCRRLAEP